MPRKKTTTAAAAAPAARERRADELRAIAVELVRPSPYQPRRTFDETALDELADSLRENGLLQPIAVREVRATDLAPVSHYEMVAGERRFRAAERLGWDLIPAVVKDLTNQEAHALALVENLQREDLSALDEARAYRRAMDELGLSQTQLAAKLGVPRSTIGDRLRLLAIPAPWLELLEAGQLALSQAIFLTSLSGVVADAHVAVDAGLRKHSWQDETGYTHVELRRFENMVRNGLEPSLYPLTAEGIRYGQTVLSATAVEAHDEECGCGRVSFQVWGQKGTPHCGNPAWWKPRETAAKQAAAAASPGRTDGDHLRYVAAAMKEAKRHVKVALPRGTPSVDAIPLTGRAPAGVALLTDEYGRWNVSDPGTAFDPADLPAGTLEALVRVKDPQVADRVGTRGANAVAAAQEAWRARWDARREEIEREVDAKRAALGATLSVTGPGCRALLRREILSAAEGEVLVEAAEALAIPVPEDTEGLYDRALHAVLLPWADALLEHDVERILVYFASESMLGDGRPRWDITPAMRSLHAEQEAAIAAIRALPVPWVSARPEHDPDAPDEDDLDPDADIEEDDDEEGEDLDEDDTDAEDEGGGLWDEDDEDLGDAGDEECVDGTRPAAAAELVARMRRAGWTGGEDDDVG